MLIIRIIFSYSRKFPALIDIVNAMKIAIKGKIIKFSDYKYKYVYEYSHWSHN